MVEVKIQLTKGKWAIIDDDDFELINKYSWHYSTHGYAATRIKRPLGITFMHRLILDLAPSDKVDTDHINRNRLDNRRCNLRSCTRSQNMMNSSRQSDSTSKYKGVCWRKKQGKWMAHIKLNGKEMFLGLYITAEEAAHVYDKKAKELFGEFCSLNFPESEI